MRLLLALFAFSCFAQQVDWVSQVRNKPFADTRQYDFAPQSPGGSVSIGSNTKTMTPCPLGWAGTDTNLKAYISGGTGTAESVPVTGGTCTSGKSSGTIIFSAAHTHSGAWKIQSSSHGIYEAIVANPGGFVLMPVGTLAMHDCFTINPANAITLSGNMNGTTGTLLDFGAVTSGCNGISITDSAYNSNEPKILQHFTMQGTGTTSGANGIYLSKVVRVIIDGVQINSFAASGIAMADAFEITITGGSSMFYNGQWGVTMSGVSNLNRIENSYVGNNSRSNGYGSVSVVGTSSPSPTQQITFDGVDFSNCGATPFTTVTTCYGLFAQWVTGLTVINSYNEGSKTQAELIQGGTAGVIQHNNFYLGAPITYASDVTAVNSSGNTFWDAPAVRVISNGDLSTYTVGPDSCPGSVSAECANHPQIAGAPTVASYLFSALPAKPNGTSVYCSDCNSTCTAGSSSGQMCFRVAGSWTH